MNPLEQDRPIAATLFEGLERLSTAMRSEQWSEAGARDLNPTQARLIKLLGQGAERVKVLAKQVGVSQPTVTASLGALERKGLVSRSADPSDARATLVALTEAGRAALLPAATGGAIAAALATLSASEQADMLLSTVKLIRALQLADAIAPQRMCVTCRHFRPHAHPGTDAPHHCTFVNAAFGNGHLRLDCGEHEAADPADQAVTWAAFQNGPAPLRANRNS